MGAAVRVREGEREQRPHVGDLAVAGVLEDDASAELQERILAGGVEPEVVEPATVEHRLVAGRLHAGNLERMQEGVWTDLDQHVPKALLFQVDPDPRIEDALVETDQPVQVVRDERQVVDVVQQLHWRLLLRRGTVPKSRDVGFTFDSAHPVMLRTPMRTVADVMTRDLVSVDVGLSLTSAAQQMHGRRVGAALVFAGERIAGIVTERDILRAVAEGRLEGTSVGDWMTRHPETIEPTDTTSTAATLMIHGGFRHLPVVEDERVVGIVSIRDLMKVVLDDEAPRGV